MPFLIRTVTSDVKPLPVSSNFQNEHLTEEEKKQDAEVVKAINANFNDYSETLYYVKFTQKKPSLREIDQAIIIASAIVIALGVLMAMLIIG